MKRVLISEFRIAESEDIMVTVAQPLWEWEQTEQGRWIKEHGVDTKFTITPDIDIIGHRVKISSQLSEIDLTYFKLRW